MKIAIDLGHGVPGFDTGAEGIVNEDVEVRTIAPYVCEKLNSLGHEVKLINITNASSRSESLQKRCDISNDFGAELFISLHLNAFKPTSDAMGCEVIGWSQKGLTVASIVELSIARLGFKSRGAKKDSLYVLRNTDAIAILVESFFVDSITDITRYRAVGENRLGYAIADGIHQAILEVF